MTPHEDAAGPRLAAGERWREVETGRVVVVRRPGEPAWYYEDDPNKAPWHCCAEDFFVWGRFVWLP